MEYAEDILFKAERTLMRRYPQHHKTIAKMSVGLLYQGGVSVGYCAICMSHALELPLDVVRPHYEAAEADTLAIAAMAEHSRRVCIVRAWLIWGGLAAVALAAGAGWLWL